VVQEDIVHARVGGTKMPYSPAQFGQTLQQAFAPMMQARLGKFQQEAQNKQQIAQILQQQQMQQIQLQEQRKYEENIAKQERERESQQQQQTYGAMQNLPFMKDVGFAPDLPFTDIRLAHQAENRQPSTSGLHGRYTPESIGAFTQSGGTDFTQLQEVPQTGINIGGKLYKSPLDAAKDYAYLMRLQGEFGGVPPESKAVAEVIAKDMLSQGYGHLIFQEDEKIIGADTWWSGLSPEDLTEYDKAMRTNPEITKEWLYERYGK